MSQSSSDLPAPTGGEIILYQTEDGRTRIQCRFENETLWLTQAQIAELFQTTPQNVTLHLKAIFAEGELAEATTCKDYLQVRPEGGREVTRKLRHYRLEAILAVGYRVRSHRGTQFAAHDYAQKEMSEPATIRNFRTVQKEGSREIARNVDFYNLDAIIAVGFRVNSGRAIQFFESDFDRAIKQLPKEGGKP
jgi:hypothetical protein